ncbi:CotH kinase protein [Kordia sp. SMS9]|uniref:CotH kinase family protein n=1 Tax=Kordia sp. SMS9 TaxID=2282170 RepID=UPI000E0CF69D|nr:CotH kinase family protein [Kordia sp. SMS9]AXG71774.1 CotH kinase protein [Kordia sp. SMS9]
MKRSFLYLFIASLSLNISCKTNVEPKVLFQTTYSSAKDSLTIIDEENALVTISLNDTDSYSKYTYTLSDENGTVHTNDTLPLSKEFSVDVKKTAKFKKYSNQDVDLNVTLIGDGVSKTITRDIDYLFDATSPIPYVVIQTKTGEFPVDRTRLDADFEFYDIPMKDGWYSMTGDHQSASGTIHARGQGSLGFPKKSFSLNFGKDNPLSIMGMPDSHKWVMIANWVDTSQLCNKVSYDSYAEMGHYGPQSRHVQVFLNGEYWGLYTYGEKIQRGKNHVNTAKKSDGGFIVKEVDNAPDFTTITGRTFQYEYPDNEEATDEQKAHIQETINSYEVKVKTGQDWEESVAEEAEIDYFIMTDVFANPDSYYNGKNVFYFLNLDNKLEPVIWDFIWAFGTPYYTCNNNNPWCYIYSPIGAAYCPTPNCTWGTANLKPQSELMYGNPNYGYSVGFNRFQLMKYYMKTAQNVNMFKDRYSDWRNGTNGKKPVLSDANILGRTDKLIAILRSGEIYKKDSIRWSVDPDFSNRARFSPEDVRTKIKERLQFMDGVVPNLKVQ